jgi:hypothetical protein
MTATTVADLEQARDRGDEAITLDLCAQESDFPALTTFIGQHFKFSLTAVTISAETAEMEPNWSSDEMLNSFNTVASIENLLFFPLGIHGGTAPNFSADCHSPTATVQP